MILYFYDVKRSKKILTHFVMSFAVEINTWDHPIMFGHFISIVILSPLQQTFVIPQTCLYLSEKGRINLRSSFSIYFKEIFFSILCDFIFYSSNKSCIKYFCYVRWKLGKFFFIKNYPNSTHTFWYQIWGCILNNIFLFF